MIAPLTSLRFFFAFIVFLSHLEFLNTSPQFESFYTAFSKEGYLGVSFFFILSGFIMSYTYDNRFQSGQMELKEYMVARVARIYPLHLLTLMLSIPLSLSVGLPQFFSNVFLLQSYVPDRSYYFSLNSPSWSISDEFFFYAMLPVLLVFWKKISKILILGVLVVPVLAALIPQEYVHPILYIHPFLRIFDFILGIFMFKLFAAQPLRVTGRQFTILEVLSVAFFFVFVFFHQFIPQAYRYSSYYWVPMCVLIFVFAHSGGKLSALLSNKVLIVLGEISFSFYLLHHLVMRYVRAVETRFHIFGSEWVLAILILGITLAGSYLLHYYFEKPMNSFIRKRFRKNMAIREAA